MELIGHTVPLSCSCLFILQEDRKVPIFIHANNGPFGSTFSGPQRIDHGHAAVLPMLLCQDPMTGTGPLATVGNPTANSENIVVAHHHPAAATCYPGRLQSHCNLVQCRPNFTHLHKRDRKSRHALRLGPSSHGCMARSMGFKTTSSSAL